MDHITGLSMAEEENDAVSMTQTVHDCTSSRPWTSIFYVSCNQSISRSSALKAVMAVTAKVPPAARRHGLFRLSTAQYQTLLQRPTSLFPPPRRAPEAGRSRHLREKMWGSLVDSTRRCRSAQGVVAELVTSMLTWPWSRYAVICRQQR